jgi:hypothetical protein
VSDDEQAERDRAREFVGYLQAALNLPDATLQEALDGAWLALEQSRREQLTIALSILDEAITKLRGETQPAVALSLERLARQDEPLPDWEGTTNDN